MTNHLGRLDDDDYPAVTMGQAAELLGVQPAFLRSLDTAGVLHPHRTNGGHRRYSRRQLALASRVRDLLDAGHTLLSAQAIAGLEDRVHDSDRAREHADRQLRQARADLHERDAQLQQARGALRVARSEIDELQRRLDDEGGGDQS